MRKAGLAGVRGGLNAVVHILPPPSTDRADAIG